MKVVRRTYSLPVKTLKRFERRVDPGDRDTVIGDLMVRWVEGQEKAEIRGQVIEGCRDMGNDLLELAQEFSAVEDEADRQR